MELKNIVISMGSTYQLLYSAKDEDNVATALEELKPGNYNVWSEANGIIDQVTVECRIPQWFKVATRDIKAGQKILKFGYPIGTASLGIRKGDIVHRCNLLFEDHLSVMKNPLIIDMKFEIGVSTALIPRGAKLKERKNLTFKRGVGQIVGDNAAKAETNIASGDTLYSGNLSETEICRLTSKQILKMQSDLASSIRSVEQKTNKSNFKIFSRQIYNTMRFYRMLKGDLALHEIKWAKQKEKTDD
jgi:hypothetical protein